MSNADHSGYLVSGIVFFGVGLFITGSVSGDLALCEASFDGLGFAREECNVTRSMNSLGVIGMILGGVLGLVGLIKYSENQKANQSITAPTVTIVNESSKAVLSPEPIIAYCSKCGNPYQTVKTELYFCDKCGNKIEIRMCQIRMNSDK